MMGIGAMVGGEVSSDLLAGGCCNGGRSGAVVWYGKQS